MLRENKLRENEKLADLIASSPHQIITTAKYKEE
jgi:hypothetical protein